MVNGPEEDSSFSQKDREDSAEGRGCPPEHRDHQFRALVDAVEEYAIFRLDPDGYIISWNSGAERIKGYDTEEILGEHFSTFYTEEDRTAGVPEENLAAAAEQGSTEDEGWRVRKDGSQFWADVTITAIRDEDNTLEGFVKVTREMTERREHEEQLRKQAERLKQQRDELEAEILEIFDRVDEAFFALDDEWRIIYVNDCAAELVRLSPGELIGARVWDVLPEVADGYPREMAEEAMATQEPVEFEFHSDLLDIWMEIRTYPSESGMSVYVRDITERKEREEALRESEERYRSLTDDVLDTSGVGTFILDSNFEIVWVNESIEEYFGLEREEIVGRDKRAVIEADIAGIFEEPERFADRVLATYEDNTYTEEFECHVLGEDALEERWLHHWSQPIETGLYAGGRIEHYTDVTDRRFYEEQLAETVEKLEESNERLEQFAYVASHDLQEPLRMISSYLQLLENQYADQLNEDAEEFIDFAVDGADRLREMIDDLLAYSRVDTEAKPLEPTDCETVVKDVLRNLERQIEENDAEIAVESLPTVHADREQLEQVFQNLVSNAIKYRGEEPPEIEISAERDAEEWVFQVADNGIGLDSDYTDRIFDVFDRLHTHEEYPGTGIGLALCRKIVERHGGDIWVQSEPGEGSTFSFTLPAEQASNN
ncbi:PAS domain S-box protein [Natrinema gelatinilyticum]|uniref:PAS domain S-box protein n=1 Tax=Natrinema gelatinilyticum TaxID=2961571 RepID=UPI0020C2A689|nr:PAS domain S-box protein [Natrinema gelatinilyticum]